VQERAYEWLSRKVGVVWHDDHCVLASTAVATSASGRFKAVGDIAAYPAVGDADRLSEVMGQMDTAGLAELTTLQEPFAVAVWDTLQCSLTIARDALGLSPGFVASGARDLLCSNELEGFAGQDIDEAFVARFLAVGRLHPDHTIWKSVTPVPPGSLLCWNRAKLSRTSYWSLDRIPLQPKWTLPEAAEEFGRRFKAVIALHLAPGGRTWSDLSGGQDSASVAAVAGELNRETADCRLGGTITFADSIGDGDETSFVEAVTAAYDLRNERFSDYAPWSDDHEPPPMTPQPMRDYPYYARDRKVAGVVRSLGASYLLSGVGPDYYFPVTAHHAADLLRAGQPGAAWRLAVEWAMAKRERIWKTAWERAACPLLPRQLQLRLARSEHPVPSWIRPEFVRRFGFGCHYAALRVPALAPRSVYQSRIVSQMAGLGENLCSWRYTDGLSIRHPFLDRSLVEFCMSLPAAVRSDVHRPKPVMIRGLATALPTEVARRHTKGFRMLSRIRRTLSERPDVVRGLVNGSTLADLGVIEPRAMLSAVNDAVRRKDDYEATVLYYALSLETWLSVRFGRLTQTNKGEAA